MFVIPKMRLNRFVPRPIVSNRELFLSLGQSPGTIVSKDTAECFSEPTLLGATKTKALGLAQDISTTAYRKHTEGSSAPASTGADARTK